MASANNFDYKNAVTKIKEEEDQDMMKRNAASGSTF